MKKWLGACLGLIACLMMACQPAGQEVSRSAAGGARVSAAAYFKIVNKGVQGNNTRDLQARLQTDVLNLKPKLVLMLVGTNDMVNSRKFVPLDEYERNLTDLVVRIKASKAKVLLMTLLPVDDQYVYLRHDPSLFTVPPSEKIRQANAVIQRVAAQQQVPVVDQYQLFVNHGETNRSADSWVQNEANAGLKDGLHPTAAGADALAKRLADSIKANKLPRDYVDCFGDSITYGQNLTGQGTATGQTYPARLKTMI